MHTLIVPYYSLFLVFILVLPEFVYGIKGTDSCAVGYKRIVDETTCTKAASKLGVSNKRGCWGDMGKVGCYTTHQQLVAFSYCSKHKTASHISPVCLKGKRKGNSDY